MKIALKTIITAFLLVSVANAYSAKGLPDVKWTAFKLAKKVGVTGTFKKLEFSSNEDADFAKFAKSLSVKIDANELDSIKNPERDKKILALWTNSKDAQITAKVVEIKGDDSKGELDLEVTMNQTPKIIKMPYTVENGKLKAKGTIDILSFGMQKGFDAYSKNCSALHGGKSWTDVDIAFELEITK